MKTKQTKQYRQGETMENGQREPNLRCTGLDHGTACKYRMFFFLSFLSTVQFWFGNIGCRFLCRNYSVLRMSDVACDPDAFLPRSAHPDFAPALAGPLLIIYSGSDNFNGCVLGTGRAHALAQMTRRKSGATVLVKAPFIVAGQEYSVQHGKKHDKKKKH